MAPGQDSPTCGARLGWAGLHLGRMEAVARMKVLEGMAAEVFLQGLDWTRGSLREDAPSQGKAGMVPREPLQSHPTPNIAIPSCCFMVPRPGWRS